MFRAFNYIKVNKLTSIRPQTYLSLFLHTCPSVLCEVEDGRAEFLGAAEAFQKSHAELLGVRVGVWQALVVGGLDLVVGGLGLDKAPDLCRTVGAHHFIGLHHLHIWREKNSKVGWRLHKEYYIHTATYY